MVEKRQGRDESSTPLGSDASAAAHEDAILEKMPDGRPALAAIHDDIASELLELAERQVAEARKKLGPQSSKPRLKRVESLFAAKAGKIPRVEEDVEKLMRGPSLIGQVAGFDGAFDHIMATGFNNFDKASVIAGAAVQSAYDNWAMAVRIYKAEMRAAGAMIDAGINAINHPGIPIDYDAPQRGRSLVDHYGKASRIGDLLLAYEKTMQQAGTDLATAFGALIGQLYGAVDSLAVAEATLIATREGAYKTFWTNVQTAMNQPALNQTRLA